MEIPFFAAVKTCLVGLSMLLVTVSPTLKATTASLPADQATSPTTSRNWSGYEASGGKFSEVSGTWTIPEVSGEGNFSADATWVGIGGISDRDLIQSGTQATVLTNGRVSYKAWLEMLPNPQKTIPIDVNSGDNITVTLNQKSPGLWELTFINNTSSERYQTNVSYDSSLTSAEWIEEAPSTVRHFVPLDNFGTINFQNASSVKDGQLLTISQAGGSAISMGMNDQTLASASDLNSDGSSFSITRQNSYSLPLTQNAGETFNDTAPQIVIYEFHGKKSSLRFH